MIASLYDDEGIFSRGNSITSNGIARISVETIANRSTSKDFSTINSGKTESQEKLSGFFPSFRVQVRNCDLANFLPELHSPVHSPELNTLQRHMQLALLCQKSEEKVEIEILILTPTLHFHFASWYLLFLSENFISLAPSSCSLSVISFMLPVCCTLVRRKIFSRNDEWKPRFYVLQSTDYLSIRKVFHFLSSH